MVDKDVDEDVDEDDDVDAKERREKDWSRRAAQGVRDNIMMKKKRRIQKEMSLNNKGNV